MKHITIDDAESHTAYSAKVFNLKIVVSQEIFDPIAAI